MDKGIVGKDFHFYKTGLIVLFVLSVLLITGSDSWASYREYDLFNQAYKSYLSYQPEKAAEEFRAFLKEFPKSSAKDAAMFWLAKSLLQMNSFKEAHRLFSQLKEQFPDSPFVSYANKETQIIEKTFAYTPQKQEERFETKQEIETEPDKSEIMSKAETTLDIEKPEELEKEYQKEKPLKEYQSELEIAGSKPITKDEVPGLTKPVPSKIEKPFYVVQIGVFTRQKTVDYLKAKYTKKKYPVKIEETTSRGIPAYKVMIGEFPDKEEAVDFAERIKQNEGLNTMIVQYSTVEAESVTSEVASAIVAQADTQPLPVIEEKRAEEIQDKLLEPKEKSTQDMQAEPTEPYEKTEEEIRTETIEPQERTIEEIKAKITEPEKATTEEEIKAETKEFKEETTTEEIRSYTQEPLEKSAEEIQEGILTPEEKTSEEIKLEISEPQEVSKEIQTEGTKPEEKSTEQVQAGLSEPKEESTEEMQAKLVQTGPENTEIQSEPTESEKKEQGPQALKEIPIIRKEEKEDFSEEGEIKKEDISVQTEQLPEEQIQEPVYGQAEYSVQIGVFANQNTANYFQDKYIKEGYPVKVTKTITKGQAAYKVMVGEFPDKKEAENFSEQVNRDEGVSTMIVEYEAREKEKIESTDEVSLTDRPEEVPLSEPEEKDSGELQAKIQEPEARVDEARDAVQSSIQHQEVLEEEEEQVVAPDAQHVLPETKEKDTDELQAMAHESVDKEIDIQHLQEKIKEQKEAQEEIEEILKETKNGQEILTMQKQEVAETIPDSISKKDIMIQIYGKNYTLQDISQYMTNSESFMKKSNMTEVLWRTGDELEDFSNEQLLYDKATKLNISLDENTQKEMIERYGLVNGEIDYLQRYLFICEFINKKLQELPGERVVESLISNYNEGNKDKKIALSTEIQTKAKNGMPFEDIAKLYPDYVNFAAARYDKLQAWVKEKIGILKDGEIGVIWSDSGYIILKPVTKRDLLKPFTYVHTEMKDELRKNLDVWIAELKSEQTIPNNANQQ